MKVKLPQEATFNKVKYGDLSKVRGQLLKYIIENKARGEFSYEFRYDKENIPVFITGKELEKELSIVRFPLVIRSNDVNYIVSNVVGSVKSVIETGLLKDRRTDYVEYEACRNVLVYNTLIEKDLSYIITIASQLATLWIKDTLTKNYRLDVFESNDIEGALFYYFLVNFIPDITEDMLTQKFLNNLSVAYSGNIGNTESIISKLSKLDRGLSLSETINAISTTKTMKEIENINIYSILNNKWYSGSDGSQYDIFASMDNLHTMIAIMYHALVTITGNKTPLGRFLKDHKRMLKSDNFISGVKNLMEDAMIR